MRNMPNIGDTVLIVKVGDKLKALPKGATPEKDDHIAVWQLPSGKLVTTGKSKVNVGDHILIHPRQLTEGNNESLDVVGIASNPGCINFGQLGVTTVESGYSRRFNIILPSWASENDDYFQVFVSPIPKGPNTVWGNWKIVDGDGNVYKEQDYHGEYAQYDEILGTSDDIPKSKIDDVYVLVTENGDGKIGFKAMLEEMNDTTTFGMCEGTSV